jgi:general secretion pathway protein F
MPPSFSSACRVERTRTTCELHHRIHGLSRPASLVGLASILVLMYFVVPRFASIFESGHLRMPLPTKILLEVSNAVQIYGPFVLGGLVLGLGAFQAYIRTPAGRIWWDTQRLRIPLLGDALRKAETARFARAMSTLVANSVPLVQAIGISRAILNNKRIAQSLDIVATGVKRGEGIAAPLRRSGQFPLMASHLLTVGEETGRLDSMFTRMADIYENDTGTPLRFTAVRPTSWLGVAIGALILSLMMAITSINENSKDRREDQGIEARGYHADRCWWLPSSPCSRWSPPRHRLR